MRVTHNHINGFPPSDGDFIFAVLNAHLREFRACGVFSGKKWVHSIERTGDKWVYEKKGLPVDSSLPGRIKKSSKNTIRYCLRFLNLNA